MKRLPLLIAVTAITACSSDEPGRLPRPEEPATVTVSVAQRAADTESYPATVTSERTAEIATRMSGTVERVHVDVGAAVRQGDALVSLDASDIRARVSAARAQAELAERSYTRIENLQADGAASLQELDQAKAALEGARAQRVEAEAQEAYAVVRAPFGGVVTRRDVDPGDLAVPGRPLFTLVAPGALKVVAELPGQRAGTLSVGDRIRVRAEGVAHAGRVTRVVPALGEGSRTFRVEATLDGSTAGLIPGTYARLEVEREGEGPRWVPEDAVITRGQLTGVFAVEADTVRLRWVRLGQHRDGAVELLAGPAGGLTVVRHPDPGLTDGRPVAAAHEEAWAVPGIGQAGALSNGEVDR
ncbi:MAG: efflux RND transporter periplasmic adaptor subunit [Gemmatimonadetes bacterium]|nr:efflux RND transporter periplasmic adaptor subunit [Gemmatimonadota bacterium]